MSTFLFICIVALIGALAAKMAKNKGRDPVIWFWLGALFGLIAIAVLYFLKDLSKEEKGALTALEESSAPVDEEKKLDSVGVWFILDKKRAPMGPFSFEDIRSMFKEGSLNASSYLWHEAWAEWKRASDVPELNKAL